MRHLIVVVVLVAGGCGSPDAAKTQKTPTGSTSSVNPANNDSTAGSTADAAKTHKAEEERIAAAIKAQEVQAQKHPKEIALDLGGGVELELVLIPAGKFMMGSPAEEKDRRNDETQHEVTITQPFYMGKYEVTQAQYERVMGDNPSIFKGTDLPVENVRWDDAQAFCKKVSEQKKMIAKLPTEAQWEYACRAGTTTEFNTGQGEDALKKAGRDTKSKGLGTRPVGKKVPNAWGLYDMHGNVWEWCQEWIDHKYYAASPPADPQGPEVDARRVQDQWARQDGRQLFRVQRGGSWSSRLSHCRSACRGLGNPGDRGAGLGFGFRVVVAASGNQ